MGKKTIITAVAITAALFIGEYYGVIPISALADDLDYFTGTDAEFSARISNFGSEIQQASTTGKVTVKIESIDIRQLGHEDGQKALPRFKAAILKNLMQGRTFFPLQIPSSNWKYSQAFLQEIVNGITDSRVRINKNLFVHPSGRIAFEVNVDLH